ncbi:uncharacterized protein LOC127711348 [Mytilus californianus]|uniref:uncharacterized protein LOC127711348 n=1 Tax=Mytilus californianus TaxID=6549 RepID=UPI0022481EEC|nr:uncharacterized protein LOC127711348 [Mytilus californianus]XP_052073337.1 uncharacterized protein LOC127711348 [Mytilus californianus]
MLRISLTVIVVIVLIGISYGREQYGDYCEKFGLGEIQPPIFNGERFCLSDRDYKYCRSYNCPTPDCLHPLTPATGVCRYCEGKCSYGGTMYNIGGFSIKCLDGSNLCACSRNNRILKTRTAAYPRDMCFKKT